MSLRSLRQWHWMILSLLIGAGVGALRQQAGEDLSGQFGSFIRSQQRFEQALTSSEQGRPWFTDISVHSRQVPDGKGGAKHVDVVSGSYFDGHYEQDDGKLKAVWNPAFFLADIPYHATTDFSRLGRPDLGARLQAIHDPTVMDLLDGLSQARGLHYTHAWWLGMGLRAWLLASFFIVGVVWPICVNFMLYGTWRRPREPRRISLSQTAAPPAPPAAAVADDDLERLRALEAALEAELADSPLPPKTPEPSQSPARRPMTAAPLVAATPAPAAAPASFAAKKEDYYPTTLRTPEHKH